MKPWQKLVRKLSGLLVAALLVIVALVVAVIALYRSAESDRQSAQAARAAAAAAHRAAGVATCVNSVLAVRGPLTEADHANERQKIEDQIRAEQDKYRGLTELANAKGDRARALAGFRVYQHGVEEFVQALNGWKTRDDRIAAAKAKHPLGRC